MSESRPLTKSGNCPECGTKIARPKDGDGNRTFYAVKSMTVDRHNGAVEARCNKCNTEVVMPVIRIARKIRKSSHAKD